MNNVEDPVAEQLYELAQKDWCPDEPERNLLMQREAFIEQCVDMLRNAYNSGKTWGRHVWTGRP